MKCKSGMEEIIDNRLNRFEHNMVCYVKRMQLIVTAKLNEQEVRGPFI